MTDIDPTNEPIYDYAMRRFNYDVEFHAKVDQAVAIAVGRIPRRVKGEELHLLRLGAALGLAMEWVDPHTGKIRDT